jgi:hypothetical protein
MGDQTNQRKVFDFLRDHAKSGATFTIPDISKAIGWKEKTGATYVSKQYADYLERASPGVFRVLPEFKRLIWEEFQDLVTQVRHPFAIYSRATFHSVVVYDFLLPLTREDKLRKALDELFYRDTLERRIQEIGLDVIAKIIPRMNGEADPEYVKRIIQFIDDRISGFSISHVSGRFRVGGILSRKESGDRLARDVPYLIDETTAVVRFIIPCLSSKVKHEADFALGEADAAKAASVEGETRQIRAIFFEVFVEALVPTIRGEKLIWMLETTRAGQRLYELNLVPRTSTSATGVQGTEEEDDAGSSDATEDADVEASGS